MLVLSRKLGERIVIEGNIEITVVAIKGRAVRIGVSAPDSVRVDRGEVNARREEFLDAPATSGGIGRHPSLASEAEYHPLEVKTRRQ